MPSSNPETIPVVIGLIWELAPKHVLDVGAGCGKYGVLFREYLEMRHAASREPGTTSSDIWKSRTAHIDAVEGFKNYVGNLHQLVYDNVYIENILDFIKKGWEYDVIFMGDVLEHIEKEVAVNELLPVLAVRAKMGVIITVPARVPPQGPEFDNELEVHRSKWRPRDFRGIARFTYSGRKGNHLITFLTNAQKYYRIARGDFLRRKLRLVKRAIRDRW